MKSSLRTLLYFLATIIATAFITAAVTLNTVNAKEEDSVVMTTDEYSEISDLLAINEIIDKINSNFYYDAPSRDELLEAAERGMVESLDDSYAAYYTAEEYDEYLSTVNGSYTGLGLLIGQPDENGAPVLDVYDDTPASAGGVLPGDYVVAVDGKSVSGLLLDEIASLISRQAGESVTLTLLRDGNSFDVSLTSAAISIKRVEHYLYNERTGYIKISMFSGNCVEEFNEAVEDLTDRGMKSLVIDLRDNPGGSLSSVVSIADAILGECDIVSVRGRFEADGEIYSSNRKSISVPIAIIVNANSASASEILAAAVQDNGAGVIVGTTTYGKGIVQTTYPLSTNGGWVKFTTDGYYTPSGKSIHGTGVVPDIEVELPEGMESTPIGDLPQEDDSQLWAALDYVRAEARGENAD